MTNPAKLLHALAFAAERHRDQRRKGGKDLPYINHPIAVAEVLAGAGQVTDEALLVAAVLHDTVEDTGTTFAELEERFGSEVTELVREVTDDKALLYDVRKQLQIEHAAVSSPKAKLLKMADKICNLRDLAAHPPRGWSDERIREYVEWSELVMAGLRGQNQALKSAFDDAVRRCREAR